MNRAFFIPATQFLGGLALLLVLASCASVSVDSENEFATHQRPKKIYVMKFSTASGEFNVDREGAELAEFKKNLQNILQVAQTTDLSDRLIPTKAAPKSPWSRREPAWLVRGEFIRVNQGSRLLRTAIGFGAGGTKMETNVSVYDLSTSSRRPFLTFTTTGGSNAEPGAAISFATDPLTLAVQIAAGGASGFSHGLTEDTKRTAREITAELSDYMYRQHWIGKEQWVQPKELNPDDQIN